MSSIKEEFLLIKFSRLIRDQDLFPTTNVILNNTTVNIIKDLARQQAINYLNPVDPNDITVTSTIST